MELKEVKSSNIKAVGYQDDDLVIEYSTGVKYKYSKVPSKVYEDLLKAESIGRFVNQNIKGTYLYERLLEEK